MPRSRTFSPPASAPRSARRNLATPSTTTPVSKVSSSCTAALARARSRSAWFTLRHARSLSLWRLMSASTLQRDSKPASQKSGQRALWPRSSRSKRSRAKPLQDPRDLEEDRDFAFTYPSPEKNHGALEAYHSNTTDSSKEAEACEEKHCSSGRWTQFSVLSLSYSS